MEFEEGKHLGNKTRNPSIGSTQAGEIKPTFSVCLHKLWTDSNAGQHTSIEVSVPASEQDAEFRGYWL
jgi:hypothetical protein